MMRANFRLRTPARAAPPAAPAGLPPGRSSATVCAPMRPSLLRSLAAGAAAGVLVAAARAPRGLEPALFPAVDGATAALVGAAPWILCAWLLGPGARRFASGVPVATLLLGALLGLALASFGTPPQLLPESRLGLALWLLIPAALLRWLAGGPPPAEVD